MRRKPHFFKVLMGKFTKRLRIPPAFLKHLSKESSDRIVLLDQTGAKWRVRLKISRTKTYLDDGWKEFVNDHSLKEAYFLVFKYLGNMHFAVKIFDGTHCEIEDACNVKMKEDPGSCKEEKRYYDYDDSLYPHPSLTKQAPGNSPKKMQLKYSSTRDSKMEKGVKIEETIHSSSETKTQPSKSHTTRKGTPSESKIEKSGLLFAPENPSFKKHMRSHYLAKGYLLLPCKFVKDYLPRKSSSIELRNVEGKSWSVKYLFRIYYATFSAGWSAFVRDNRLMVGDECIFELVGDKVMHVHVI